MMPQRAAIESHIAVKKVAGGEPDAFANEEPFTRQPSGRAVFGGLLLSQALMAASETVPPDLYPYSSQSSFLRPVTVKAQDRVTYCVERTADGRNSATRIVRALHGTDRHCVYTAIVSFQRKNSLVGGVLAYGTPMPDLDGLRPDDIGGDVNQQLTSASAARNPMWQLMGPDEDPFDWRPFGFILTDEPWECRTRGFSRSPPLSTDSAAVHIASLAFMSDQVLLGVPLFANPEKVGAGMQNVTMAATLNHTMAFHDPAFRMDEWVVAERETSWAGEGRALIHQRIWGLESGRLVMTCTQEAAIRLKEPKEKL
ncbi:putative acyl- thioesterase ii protein [Rosellinia necatrix]|uniref:Putative acyl-thioesterase ii protein n=1 Tax=Rosellinia necatrix TaxID=77044 RepID=A0A1S8AB03_ROSNE|nr:putative acyl- thioesterase ii protein [Rosellinia necatrix]